jgi:hypothetical protein
LIAGHSRFAHAALHKSGVGSSDSRAAIGSPAADEEQIRQVCLPPSQFALNASCGEMALYVWDRPE